MSYGKVHRTFFRSSINDQDPIVRLIFIGMIVLSDAEGVLDITRSALARELNIDPGEIDRAIEILTSPDDSSRSPSLEGRRIVPIDPRRSWGWIVVNKEKYRSGEADPEYVRVQTKQRVRRFRKKEKEASKEPTDTYTAVTESNGSNGDVTQKTLPRTRKKAAERSEAVGQGNAKGGQRFDADAAFAERWAAYPRREGKRDARRHFGVSVRTADDLERFDKAYANFSRKMSIERTEAKFIPYGSTFFNAWEDYLDWTPGRPARSAERAEGLGGLVV